MGRDVSRISRILAIAEPIAVERGLEILDIEIGGTASNPLVRVLLDSPEEGRRVAIDDCQEVSQRLGDALDAYDAVAGRYMLEVSSPGVNRPLKRPEHFRRVLGQKVRVRSGTAVGERRTLLGRLESVDETGIEVATDAGTERVAFDAIDKANLEFEFGPARKGPTKPGKKKRRQAAAGKAATRQAATRQAD